MVEPRVDTDFVPVKSADRTLDVLEKLSSGPATLSTLSTGLGIPKSSLHSILRTLESRHWVTLDDTRSVYRLGMNALLVGSAFVDQDAAVVRSSELMDRISAETGETVHLGRIEGPDVIYLAKRESVHPLRMFSAIGRRRTVHSTALGKAMAAELSDDTLRRILPEVLAPAAPKTITDREEFISHLAEVRTQGYAIDAEEAEVGLRCFAVALEFQSPAREAISCSVPMARLDAAREESIVNLLLDIKAQVAQQSAEPRISAG